MKKTTLLVLFVILALFFSTWTPAVAFPGQVEANTAKTNAGLPLTITNPMPKATTVTLEGPQKYTIKVQAGGTANKSIDKGNYKYKYEGCGGKPVQGVLKQKAGVYTLAIKPCKTVALTFYNTASSTTYNLKLTGWMNYQISVSPGQMKTLTVVSGTYDVVESCGSETWKGKVKFGKNRVYLVC